MPSSLRALSEAWWPRIPWLIASIAGLTPLALAIALATVDGPADDRPRASVGELIEAPVEQLPHSSKITLPWESYTIEIGETQAELPELGGEPSNLRAPESGSFVPIHVTPQRRPTITDNASTDPTTKVVLRADDRDYPLTNDLGLDFQSTDLSAELETWLAVSGRPDQVSLRITVDGETQVVRAEDGSVDRGRATGLDGLPTASDALQNKPARCGRKTRLDSSDLRLRVYGRDSCASSAIVRTPSVPGLGWAPQGREYAVIQMKVPTEDLVTIDSPTSSPPVYWHPTMRIAPQFGTAKPVTGPTETTFWHSTGLFAAQQWVFEVATDQELGDLTLTGDIRARLGDPFVTERERLRVSWTIPGEELA